MDSIKTYLIAALVLIPLVYYGNPAVGLLVGAAITLVFNRPLIASGQKIGKYLLQTAIILLGIKLNIHTLWQLNSDYMPLVTGYVLVTAMLGLGLGLLLKSDQIMSRFIAFGTAICGGTTIASLAPIYKARAEQVGVALAIVFLLNAVALFVFPHIGHWLQMTQEQFGVWAALAIHDTSSVVATAAIYGDEAAVTAATVKLGRTLWLIPAILLVSIQQQEKGAKLRVPLFILLFIGASALSSLVTLPTMVPQLAGSLSKALLVIALFMVGTEISRDIVSKIRGRIVWQALILWLLAASVSLYIIMHIT